MTLWTPIAEYKPELIDDGDQLAVWVVDESGRGEAFIVVDGMTVPGDDGRPIEFPPDALMGEWRAIDDLRHVDPSAFTIISPYDPSGEAHEPPDYSAQAQLDHRTSDYQTKAA